MNIENWQIEEITGYKPITSFYTDFSIADKFGINAIVNTYNLSFNNWKYDYKYITELVLVLNWKIWRWYKVNVEYSNIYKTLWVQLDEWCVNCLKGKELEYYYKTID